MTGPASWADRHKGSLRAQQVVWWHRARWPRDGCTSASVWRTWSAVCVTSVGSDHRHSDRHPLYDLSDAVCRQQQDLWLELPLWTQPQRRCKPLFYCSSRSFLSFHFIATCYTGFNLPPALRNNKRHFGDVEQLIFLIALMHGINYFNLVLISASIRQVCLCCRLPSDSLV